MNGSERTGRDGRLLALVIVVSLAVLLVLAKFRFASDGRAADPDRAARTDRRPFHLRGHGGDGRESDASGCRNRWSCWSRRRFRRMRRPAQPARSSASSRSRCCRRDSWRPFASVVGNLAVGHVPAGYQVTDGQGLSRPVEVVAVDAARSIVVVRATSVFETRERHGQLDRRVRGVQLCRRRRRRGGWPDRLAGVRGAGPLDRRRPVADAGSRPGWHLGRADRRAGLCLGWQVHRPGDRRSRRPSGC